MPFEKVGNAICSCIKLLHGSSVWWRGAGPMLAREPKNLEKSNSSESSASALILSRVEIIVDGSWVSKWRRTLCAAFQRDLDGSSRSPTTRRAPVPTTKAAYTMPAVTAMSMMSATQKPVASVAYRSLGEIQEHRLVVRRGPSCPDTACDAAAADHLCESAGATSCR